MQGGQGFGGLRQPMGNPAMRSPGVYSGQPGQLMQPRMMDTGSMLPQNPMLAAYAQSNPGGPQNTNGYTLPPGNTSMFSSNPAPYGMTSITTPGDRPGFAPGQMAPNGSMVVRNPATGRLEYAGHSGVPGMNGTWQDDYRDRFGNVGPAQTINGQNFIGDRLYNAEGLNQGGLGGFNSLANFYGLLGR